jgi:uncharacterized metal-binding protein YceD (DUF177 family)
MEALVQYTIPVKGLGQGIHQFEFQIDRHFFQHFEASPIEDGAIKLKLTFDKRVDMFILDFVFEGTVKADCDRCLAKIDLPIADQQQLLVKLSIEQESDEAEVVYVSPEISKLNVAKYAYEFICLAMPLIKVYDCENEQERVCNDEMLAYLEQSEADEAQESENPIWEELKKFNSDK